MSGVATTYNGLTFQTESNQSHVEQPPVLTSSIDQVLELEPRALPLAICDLLTVTTVSHAYLLTAAQAAQRIVVATFTPPCT